MNDTNENNPLGYEKLSVLLKRFAIPSIIAMVVSSLYNIVDQIFIGQGVGYLGNAATNVAFPLTTICLAITLLISIGSASRFSLSLGEGDADRAAQAVGNALAMMVLFGILYTLCIEIFLVPLLNAFGATQDVLPYAIEYTRITAVGMPLLIITNGMSNLARADGSPNYSMMCMLIGAIINTILDPLFIFKFHMGVRGAAFATVIGQFFSFLMALYYVKKFTHIRLKKQHFILKPQVCLNIASLGMSNCLNQVAITFVQIVMNNTLTYYGSNSVYGSDIPLACAGIISKVNMLFFSFVIGISQGLQPIVSFNFGAQKYDRVKDAYKKAVFAATAISIVAFLCFQFFPRQIIGIFGSGSEEYLHFAERYFRIFLFFTFLNGIQPVSSNFFTSIGAPKKGIFLSLTRQIIFLLPLLLIFPYLFGIDGVMYTAPIADLAAASVSIVMVVREFKIMAELQKAAA